MAYTYCTKLSVDSAAITDNTSFDPSYGFPFAGFVNFTERGETQNPFESSQDYLQRWDSANEIIDQDNTNTTICSEANGTCVKINGMYCSTSSNIFHPANLNMFKESNKVFLSMVPLAKNINSDERGLSFFMDMESEIKTEQTIALPYSTNSTVDGCYLDFCAAGFCKSNVPYIGLEYISRMINLDLDLDVDSSTNYYSLYSSTALNDIFGNTERSSLVSSQNTTDWLDTYECPGQGSLLLSPYLLVDRSINNINLDDLVSNTYDDDTQMCFTWKLCVSIRDAIAALVAKAASVGEITKVGAGNYKISFDEQFEGDEEEKISSYCSLLRDAGAIYFKDSSGNFNPLHSSDNDEIFSTFTFRVIFNSGGSDWSYTIGNPKTCSLYNNSLSYYLDKGEKFKRGLNSYCDASDIKSGNYLFVIRSIADTLLPTDDNPNLYDSSMAKSFLGNCNLSTPKSLYYNRMDLYPNTSGKMTFFKDLDINTISYASSDSSIFKPKTSQIQTNKNAYINYIPAFDKTPSWNTLSYTQSSKLSNMGVIEDSVKIKFNGALYVSEVTLVFEGDTISSLSESSNIIVGNDKKSVRSGLVNSQGNIEFTFTFNESSTPAKISPSNGKATKNNMNVYAVGAHQMLKYCSFPGYTASENTSFDSIYRLDANNNSVDSQMTFTKITGRIPVRLSGTGLYDNGSTNVKLISAYIKLTDTSSLDVCVYSLGIVEKNGYPYSNGSLAWLGTHQTIKFISPKKVELPYTIYRPFLGSMSGDIPRYSSHSYDTSLHTMGISSFTSHQDEYKSKIGLDSSNNVTCVGPNYKDSFANGGTLKTFSDPNSAYTIDLEFKQLTYDLGLQKSDGTTPASDTRGTSVGAKSVYYSISENPFASGPNLTSINSQLNNGSTYIDFLLPEPHLNAVLVYDSVEFNRASAWTFMRSMPLQPGSADAPHILIYKVEAWVTEEGTTKVDEESTMSMHFDYKVSSIFSGYVSSEDSKNKSNIFDDYNLCVKGINDAILYEPDILNNCYLKVDDNGNTEELNAVGTAFPIIDITGNDSSYYGAPGLTAKIYSNIESFEDSSYSSDDNYIYNKLFSKAKEILEYDYSTSSEEGAQVVVLSYCHPDLKPSSTGSGDKRKIIYICVGFYNNREEMIPINGKFGITYTVTPNGGDPTTYTKYMYLSEFFPKDSMIYLAGNNYKNNTEKEENNKFAFVTDSIRETYTNLIGDGVNSNDASISTDNSEIINIGPGDGMSYEIASSSTSKSEDGYWGYPGHYGILNRYSGKVSFVSDVPYENYTEYTNSLEGKCLLNYEHICYFPNKTGVAELL